MPGPSSEGLFFCNQTNQYMKIDLIPILNNMSDSMLDELRRHCEVILNQRHQARSKSPDASIIELKISTRLYFVLKGQNIQRVSDLSKYTRYQVNAFRNFGRKCMDELEYVMSQHGVKFKDESF